jgi:SH3-like domain-containing protein
MIMRKVILILAAFATVAPAAVIAQKALPYWASISTGEARMRTGPGRQFPASWVYRRAGLPVKVIETYPNWRKVQDPDGATGWIQANLIGDTRTALVTGEIRDLRANPDPAAVVVWRAEPGVVGAISQCAKGWCLLDVKGRQGYVEISGLWGVAADERLP